MEDYCPEYRAIMGFLEAMGGAVRELAPTGLLLKFEALAVSPDARRLGIARRLVQLSPSLPCSALPLPNRAPPPGLALGKDLGCVAAISVATAAASQACPAPLLEWGRDGGTLEALFVDKLGFAVLASVPYAGFVDGAGGRPFAGMGPDQPAAALVSLPLEPQTDHP